MTNTLPPPKPVHSTTHHAMQQQPQADNFNLNEWHENFKKALQKQENIACTKEILPDGFIKPATLLYELIDRDIWRLRGHEVIKKHLGYSTKYQSLTISLLQEDNSVKTICIRKALDKAGNPIKWKTYGSKRYIPYKIFDQDDPVIFIGFGIGEFLLLELLEFNYMVIQSDSIAKNLAHNPYAPKLENFFIFALLDNDESCKTTIEPLQKHFSQCSVHGIDFENLLDKELPKGYDFRDFCNEIAKETRGNALFAKPNTIKAKIQERLASEITAITKE